MYYDSASATNVGPADVVADAMIRDDGGLGTLKSGQVAASIY